VYQPLPWLALGGLGETGGGRAGGWRNLDVVKEPEEDTLLRGHRRPDTHDVGKYVGQFVARRVQREIEEDAAIGETVTRRGGGKQ